MRHATGLGFHVLGSEIWTAGNVYAANLMRGLRETFGAAVKVNLLIHGRSAPTPLIADAADEVLVYPTTQRWSAHWWRERVPKRVFKYDVTADEFLKQHGIETIVFGDAPQGSKIPTIDLIPDFQPFYLPAFFSARELAERHAAVNRIGSKATRLVAFSESVYADMKKFAPQFLDKTRVVMPASDIPANVYELEPAQMLAAYHLPERFFYIPNQFWQHKNHLRVFEALDILKARNVNPFVVMTGLFHDHRAPDFTAALLGRISELNLRDHVALLGLVPRETVYALMRQAIAVINPSLFEGYGMTVAETRWLGKRALLSDIPAHRVQSPPCAWYFDPEDANALADVMERGWKEFTAGPDGELERVARRDYPAHQRACAQEFMNMVKEIVPNE